MDQGHTDNFESPLEDVLDNLPQEQPPADLKDRCLSALRKAEASRTAGSSAPAGQSWWSPLRTIAAIAACFLAVVGIASMMAVFAPAKKSEPMSGPPSGMMMKGGPAMMPPPASGEEKGIAAAPAPSGGMAGGGMAPPPPPSAPPGWTSGPKSATPSGSSGKPNSPPPAAMKGAAKAAPAPGVAAMKAEAPYSSPSFRPTDGAKSGGYRPGGGTETPPWRDESGDRQRITSKRMELEVPKVEEAYDRAISIIEKADGHTTTEDLQVRDDGKNRGHIVARVPIDKFEGVMAQLRELGKVKLLTGEREDVTKEYNNRGGDIRETGASEDELVAEYEKETDPARKQQLYSQIQELRNTNSQHKNALESLSEQTHYALLDLTLIEQAGPGRFFSQTLENTGKLGLWLLATAVIWVPLLIVGYFFFRRRRQPGAG